MSGAVGVGVVAAGAALRVALGSSCSGSSGAELLADLGSLAVLRNLVDAVETQVLAGVEDARRAGVFASTKSTVDLLVDVVPTVTAGEAKRRVQRADALTPRRTLNGEVLPPLAPVAAAGCRDGVVSGVQADIVIGTLDRLPHWCDVATVEVVESTLVEACPHLHPSALTRFADAMVRRLDQDGPEPAEPEPVLLALRESRRPDGRVRFTLDTDNCGAAALRAVLDPLAEPAESEDGTPDPRSAAGRRHDALLEACHRLLRSDTLPHAGGAPVTILATTTLAELRDGKGLAFFDRGDAVPITTLLAMTGDAQVIPVLQDDYGAILCLGRTQRCASTAQRRALTARDRGCCFPGCDKPAAWTEVHHITDWASGGPTDIDNLCLLCRHHHAAFSANGWTVRMVNGTPEWLPPPWIDPQRKPRRNRVRHRPEMIFSPLTATQRDGPPLVPA